MPLALDVRVPGGDLHLRVLRRRTRHRAGPHVPPGGLEGPNPKRIEDFDYAANPNVAAALIATLAKGAWVAAGSPGAAWSATPAPASPTC